MKNLFLPLIFVFFLVSSCEKKEEFIYEYEKNPQYTWGYARFWGAYYADYEIDSNVLSLSAFTTSLSANDEGDLIGTGQYLFIEDIFIASSDTLFPTGTYHISDSGDAFTIARGEVYTEDNVKYDIGARVYYIEENENYSIRKFIDKGSMTVSRNGDITRFDFNFILNDSSELKGNYEQLNLEYIGVVPVEYPYEKNPQFTWGYAHFWGNYYADYNIYNNVLSLAAFTEGLDVDTEGYLLGQGQYLYLEDVFVAPADTLFPAGVYQISNTGDAFTIAPGEVYEFEGKSYDLGAWIYYKEENTAKSIRMFIVDGSMEVSYVQDTTKFDFDFVLEDSTILKGNYKQYQLHYEYHPDQYKSVAQQKVKSNQIKVSSSVKFKTKPQDERRQKNNAKQVIQTKFRRQGK